MKTERVLLILWIVASLCGCASLTGKDTGLTSKDEPDTGPFASAEPSTAPGTEVSPATVNAPSAAPEQSRVYESDAVKADPTLKSGSGSKGWSVPAEPSPSETARDAETGLQPSNAMPDLGMVKSDVQSSLHESASSITGGEVSGSLENARSTLDQGVASTRSLIEDPFAPVTSTGSTTLKSTFPELGATSPSQSIASQTPATAQQPSQVASAPGTVRGGQAAPAFIVTTLDGSSFDLSSHKGKVVVLDFWRKTCGPCLKAMPQLAQIRSSYPETQLTILGMNTDETRNEAESFLRSHPHHWPNVHVLSQRTNVLNPYGVRLLPTFVVIDQVGNIQYRGNDVNQAGAKVAELVATPSIPNTSYMAALR